jgi:hypothetical protein
MWCVMLTYIFCNLTQVDLVPAVGEKWHCLAQHRDAFHRLGVQDVTEFDFDSYSVFCLFGEE